MIEPAASRGPLHGPPPIAMSPSGKLKNDTQHAMRPALSGLGETLAVLSTAAS